MYCAAIDPWNAIDPRRYERTVDVRLALSLL